jgi:hypothetical protein
MPPRSAGSPTPVSPLVHVDPVPAASGQLAPSAAPVQFARRGARSRAVEGGDRESSEEALMERLLRRLDRELVVEAERRGLRP